MASPAPPVSDDLSALPRPGPIRPPTLGPLGWLRWGWRQLTSMRTALVLLFLLALAAVPGSFFPQRGVDPGKVAGYARAHPALFPWLDRLSLFDVYVSPWFSAVYLLLFLSLAGCVLPRSRQHWTAMRARPPAAPRHLARLPESRRFQVDAPPAAVLATARTALRGERFRVDGTADAVSAEKGYLRETGNLAFHLALLLLLVAVAAGHLGGFRANVLVPEGRGFSNSVVQYDEFRPGTRFDPAGLAPFTVTLDRLDVRYEQDGTARGAPRQFTANVRYRTGPGEQPRAARIAPNSPLVVGGAKVFLLGNGYAPRFTVRDGTGQVVLTGPVPLLPQPDQPGLASAGVLKVPDAAPDQLGLTVTFLPTATATPFAGTVSTFPDATNPRVFVTGAWRGDLGADRAQSVYRLDTSRMTRLLRDGQPLSGELAPGDRLSLPDGLGSVTFDGVSRFANFSVSANPGSTPALAAALLALAGLMTSLFTRRRRIWVRAQLAPEPDSSGPGARRTVVEIAGLARTDYDGLVGEIDRVAAALQRSPTRRSPTRRSPTRRSSGEGRRA